MFMVVCLIIENEAKEIALTYRNNYHQGSNDQCKSTDIYRGFEKTSKRKLHQFIVNSAVIMARRQGVDQEQIATFYKECNAYAEHVAVIQAMNDYKDCHASLEFTALPTVSSMEPPKLHPYAIHCAKTLRREKIEAKRRMHVQSHSPNTFDYTRCHKKQKLAQ
jgi:hypothetical protein